MPCLYQIVSTFGQVSARKRPGGCSPPGRVATYRLPDLDYPMIDSEPVAQLAPGSGPSGRFLNTRMNCFRSFESALSGTNCSFHADATIGACKPGYSLTSTQ